MTSYNGTAGNDTLPGTNGDDIFDISQGGDDTLFLQGGDTVLAGAALTSADRFYGSGLLNLTLDGDYTGLRLDATIMPVGELRKVTLAAGHDYGFSLGGDLASSNTIFNVDASGLGLGDDVTFDFSEGHHTYRSGYGQLDTFSYRGGLGTDTIVFTGNGWQASVDFNFTDSWYGMPAQSIRVQDHNGKSGVVTGVERLKFNEGIFVLGTRGDDVLGPQIGVAGYILGGGANVVTPGVGSFHIQGGVGTDIIVLAGNLADYTFGTDPTGKVVITKGADIVTEFSVDKVQFDDVTVLLGSPYNDELLGTRGDDVFVPLTGNDSVNGGPGNDMVLYYKPMAGYSVTKIAGGTYRVVDTTGGSPTDGTDMVSNIETLRFSDGTMSLDADIAPVMTTTNFSSNPGHRYALSQLFTVSDGDGDTMTRYELWDSTRDAASGHFEINGVAQAAGTVIGITAAQLAQTSFVTGTVGDGLQIRAYDGILWTADADAAWSPFRIDIGPNHAPVVTTSNRMVARGSSTALSSLFSVSDADGDGMTRYQLWDSMRDAASGYFVINGVAQAAGTVIDVSAAQLAQTSFVAGSISDVVHIRAFDGTDWSAGGNDAWSPFLIDVANNAPVVTTGTVATASGQTLALSSLFSVSDANGDAITRYQLWDSTRDAASGHFVVGGVAQAPGTVIDISAAQLAQTSFVTGVVGDNLHIRAFDGTDWSAGDNDAWSPFQVTVPVNHAPVVATSDVTAAANQSLALSGLITVSDADGDSITRYQLWDSTRDAASGYFSVNGVVQTAGTVINITAAQLAQTSFVTGRVADSVHVRAFDGTNWSAGDDAAWSPFRIDVPANHAPVVATSDVAAQAGDVLALSSLISVSDADSDAITRYQLWDSGRAAASGNFVINGVAQAAGTVIDITAAQLAQTSFRVGTIGDNLQVRAFDGFAWSAGDNAAWSPFLVTVS